jgi:hypothetical protein
MGSEKQLEISQVLISKGELDKGKSFINTLAENKAKERHNECISRRACPKSELVDKLLNQTSLSISN